MGKYMHRYLTKKKKKTSFKEPYNLKIKPSSNVDLPELKSGQGVYIQAQ